jgi:hypothetical protein
MNWPNISFLNITLSSYSYRSCADGIQFLLSNRISTYYTQKRRPRSQTPPIGNNNWDHYCCQQRRYNVIMISSIHA